MKHAGLLLGLILVATIFVACGGQRLSQCDPANAPGANCYQQQGPPYRN